MFDQIPRMPSDDELIEVLSAISIVALRLAKLLEAAPTHSHPDAATRTPRYACPLYQERRASHEAV